MGCGDEKLSKYLTQTFRAHCNAMICQQVTLLGDAEWPKVADDLIEALVWHTTPTPIRLELGDDGRRLLHGTTSWDDNAASALAEWTAVVALLVQQSDA